MVHAVWIPIAFALGAGFGQTVFLVAHRYNRRKLQRDLDRALGRQ